MRQTAKHLEDRYETPEKRPVDNVLGKTICQQDLPTMP